jgi:hypothetical protein
MSARGLSFAIQRISSPCKLKLPRQRGPDIEVRSLCHGPGMTSAVEIVPFESTQSANATRR